jgi:hypothetical protein
MVGILVAVSVVLPAMQAGSYNYNYSDVAVMLVGLLCLITGMLLVDPSSARNVIRKWKWLASKAREGGKPDEEVKLDKDSKPDDKLVLSEIRELRQLIEDQGTVSSAVAICMALVGFIFGWLVG